MPLQLKENLYRSRQLPRNDAVIMGRAELLDPEDRDLLEAVLMRGQKVSCLARMLGVTPRSLRSRLHRIACRLTSKVFLNAGRALPYLPDDDRKIARMKFCEGVSVRQISSRLGVTEHALRRRMDRINAQIETILRIHSDGKNREDK